MSLFIVSIMNTMLNTLNNIKNHHIFQKTVVNKTMIGFAIVLSAVVSLIYLPTLCFMLALGKTIMYSHLTSYSNRVNDRDIKKSNELANSWLIYCFVEILYFLMNFVLGGLFLVVAQLLITVVVADMTFLKDTEDTTLPIAIFKIVDKIVDKYRTSKSALFLTESFEYFGKVTYPRKRTALYRYIMAYISRKMYNNPTVNLESRVDLNQSMMECESPVSSPRSSPKYHVQKPILVIELTDDAQESSTTDNDKNMDIALSDILETLNKHDDNFGALSQSVPDYASSGTASPVSDIDKKHKSHKSHKSRRHKKTNSDDKQRDSVKVKLKKISGDADKNKNHDKSKQEQDSNQDNVYKLDQYNVHSLDLDSDLDQINVHSLDLDQGVSDNEVDNSDDDLLYDKTLLDTESSHQCGDSDRSLDEN